MLNIFFLAALGFLAASTAALSAARSARRRERSSWLLADGPAASLSPSPWPRLRAALAPREDRPLKRGTRLLCLAALGLAILALTRNLLLALLPWPAFHLARRLLERRSRERSRARKEEQVLELIDSLSQSLRSGLSLQQSLETSLEDVGEEMGGEIGSVLNEVRLGSGLEEALSRAALDSDAPSLKLTLTVLALMHGKGGDLPRILERLRRRVADGVEARREARILTSQGRASGYLVSSLPAVFLLLQAALNPDSLRPLFATPAGNLIIAAALALNAAGFLLIRKIMGPEV